jgi:hypothetical protein
MNNTKVLVSIYTILLLVTPWSPAFSQPKKIVVIFGNGEEATLSDWSFVYQLVEGDEVFRKGSSPNVAEKKSRNLYLIERYEEEEDKILFSKSKEINIDGEKLSSIEYRWNWEFSSMENITITLNDGTKLVRARLGPIATSFFSDETIRYAKGIYLEGTYRVKGEEKHLRYNLNKWLEGGVSKEEIIVKIIFQ